MHRNFAGSPVSQGGGKKQDGICPDFIEILVCPARIERATPSLEGWCSIQLSYGHNFYLSKVLIMRNPALFAGLSYGHKMAAYNIAKKCFALNGIFFFLTVQFYLSVPSDKKTFCFIGLSYQL